ncbi:MAG: ribonuclease III domain-containing protein [Candidatus Melainabacteria bacterium]|nr:ribonuclease III domain-containing protein [Candidatus Melainabacteria bacterium]
MTHVFEKLLETAEAKDVPLRMLAHLGDAVFELFEREREVLTSANAQKLHKNVVRRVNAVSQAAILEALMDHLTDAEKDIVRRARNMKVTGSRKVDQSAYRYATALEALVGYLYLTDKARLTEVLDLTL